LPFGFGILKTIKCGHDFFFFFFFVVVNKFKTTNNQKLKKIKKRGENPGDLGINENEIWKGEFGRGLD